MHACIARIKHPPAKISRPTLRIFLEFVSIARIPSRLSAPRRSPFALHDAVDSGPRSQSPGIHRLQAGPWSRRAPAVNSGVFFGCCVCGRVGTRFFAARRDRFGTSCWSLVKNYPRRIACRASRWTRSEIPDRFFFVVGHFVRPRSLSAIPLSCLI